MKAGRNERKYRIIDFLHEKGVDISLEEVEKLAGGDVIGRPHFAQVMVRRGYVQSNREAFAAIWTRRSTSVLSAGSPASAPV